MIALLGNKLIQYLLAGVAVAALFGGYSWYIYEKGYSSASITIEVAYRKKYDDELNRQLEAQDKVLNNQKQIITDLQEKNADLDQKLKENIDEASKDPNANGFGISQSSVVRLNKIR